MQGTAALPDLQDGCSAPHPAAVRHHRVKTHLVAAKIKRPRQVFDAYEVRCQGRNQGQGQVAMRNGLAVGKLLRGTLPVNVDPLVIIRGIGKTVDPFLVDRDPVGHANLLSLKGLRVLD